MPDRVLLPASLIALGKGSAMPQQIHLGFVLGLALASALAAARAPAFEGRISASISRGGPPAGLLYTVGTNFVRVEMTDTNVLNTVDVLDRRSGTVTLLLPRNHCFIRLGSEAANPSTTPSDFPSMADGLPPGIGPQTPPVSPAGTTGMPGAPAWPQPPGTLPPGIGPTNFARLPAPRPFAPAPVPSANPGLSAMRMAMMPAGGGFELRATGQKTNLLGYACDRYEIKQWGQTMEIWATDQLLPFQDYLSTQPPRAGPPMIELRWGELLSARKLFPLLASLRFANGLERYHFEVRAIMPGRLTAQDARRFEAPQGYVELPSRPF
jgi:Domain of unknown function (DUF4412)